MNKEYLLKQLEMCKHMETEEGHIRADELLLEYINDPEITKTFNELGKWYA